MLLAGGMSESSDRPMTSCMRCMFYSIGRLVVRQEHLDLAEDGVE